MSKKKNKSLSIKKVVSLYWATEAIRFVVSVLLIYKIFQALSIGEYARYSIIQSLGAFLALLFSFNVDSSMQKVFSKKKLATYSSVIYIVIVTFLVLVVVSAIIVIAYLFPWLKEYITGGAEVYFYLVVVYTISIAINGCIQSYSNASSRNFLYAVTLLLQPTSFLVFIYWLGISNLNQLITYATISYFFPVIFLFLKWRTFNLRKLKSSRILRVTKYIFFYSLPSFPALGSKYLLDYLSRLSILQISGEIGVAAIALVNTMFSIFRAIEKAFFRAVTPFILKGENMAHNLSVMSNLLRLKVVGLFFFIVSSSIWFPFLRILFPDKQPEVFSHVLLIGMAIIYTLSLVKNYYMTLSKKNITNMKQFFHLTSILNVIGCIYVVVLGVSDKGYLGVLFCILLVNILILRKKYSPVIVDYKKTGNQR